MYYSAKLLLARTIEYFKIPRSVLTLCLENQHMQDESQVIIHLSLNGGHVTLEFSTQPIYQQKEKNEGVDDFFEQII